jgi:uncharacterized membrane protein (DUF2068 family)
MPDSHRRRSSSRTRRTRAERFRLFVVIVKLVTGGVEVVVGAFLLGLSVAGLQDAVSAVAREDRRFLQSDVAVVFVEHALRSVVSNKRMFALSLLALGTIKIVSAIGLLKHRAWGFYLLLAVVILLLPVDVVHSARHFSLPGLLFVALNASVLTILIAYRKQLVARDAA